MEEEELRKQVELHSAGATVQHAGPYSDLEVPSSMESPSDDFYEKWVAPFYMWEIRRPNKFVKLYSPIRREVDRNLILSLLVWFNYRSRLVAAYFAAIEDMTEFTEHLGRLLLRSDVTYAGEGYALALATFNSELAREFLTKYLDYHLSWNIN